MPNRGLLTILALLLSATGAMGATLSDIVLTNGADLYGIEIPDVVDAGVWTTITHIVYATDRGTNGAIAEWSNGVQVVSFRRNPPAIVTCSNFTVSFWQRTAARNDSVSYLRLGKDFSTNVLLFGKAGWSLHALDLYFRGPGSSTDFRISTAGSVQLADTNSYYNLTMTFDASVAVATNRIKIYVNGTNDTFSPYTGTIPTSLNIAPHEHMFVSLSAQARYADAIIATSTWSADQVLAHVRRTYTSSYDANWPTNYPDAISILRIMPEDAPEPPAAPARRSIGPIYNAWLMGGQR